MDSVRSVSSSLARGMSVTGASWGNRPHVFLVECALAGSCVVGVWVTVKLLEQFSSSLKPFVLSLMFVGCLEAFVQILESGMIKCVETPCRFCSAWKTRAMKTPKKQMDKVSSKLSKYKEGFKQKLPSRFFSTSEGKGDDGKGDPLLHDAD